MDVEEYFSQEGASVRHLLQQICLEFPDKTMEIVLNTEPDPSPGYLTMSSLEGEETHPGLRVTLDEAEQRFGDASARKTSILHQTRVVRLVDQPKQLSSLAVRKMAPRSPYHTSTVTINLFKKEGLDCSNVSKPIGDHFRAT